jgi:hypothetical protein
MRKQERVQVPLPAAILCLALACVLPALSFAGDQYHAELARVAILPGGFAGYFPCGVNHKGCGDVFGTCGGIRDSLLVCENDSGGNAFRQIRPGLVTGPILDLAYRDGDSLAEMLTQYRMDSLKLYRAFSRDSFPTHQVWSVYTPYQIDYALFCRLDPDGPLDIVACGRVDMGLYVYENEGADSWVEVPFPQPHPWLAGNFAVGDFDSDGYAELAGGNDNGYLLVFECLGPSQFTRVCSLSYAPNQLEDYIHTSANDMDQNGHPELISIFRRYNMPVDSCLVRIYEEPEHGDFVCVDSLTFAYEPSYECVAAGDVDGDRVPEFAISTGFDIRLFKSVGPGQYAETWQWNRGGFSWIRFFDINRDSRDELLIRTADTTYVYEDTNGLGTAIFEKPAQLHPVSVQPTIARLGAPVMFSGVPPGSDIEVLSLDGRLVSRASGVRQSTWSWNLRNQSGNLVPAGTYFAVIRSKGKSTSLKLCLVK